MRRLPRLHIVTDDATLADSAFTGRAAAVLSACGAGCALVLRGHHTAGRVLYDTAAALVPVARSSGALLLINDRIDVALALAPPTTLDGVQLGARSLTVDAARQLLGSAVRVGYSAHTADEALTAVQEGADYVVAGTIFRTESHPGREPAGVRLLNDCARRTAAPVIAIGGVTAGRAAEVAGAGAHGVAVLRGVWQAAEPVAAARALMDAVTLAWQDREAWV